MKKIILIGAGGHARSCIDVIRQTKKFKIIGLVSDDHPVGSFIMGCKILSNNKQILKLKKLSNNLLIAFGSIYNQKIRSEKYNYLKGYGFLFPQIISPRAYVAKLSSIGNGTIIHHNVTINANTVIGENCIINTKANIEHDCTVENHCHVSTMANISGNVKILSGSFIGGSSVVKENVIIKKNTFIKMGSIVK